MNSPFFLTVIIQRKQSLHILHIAIPSNRPLVRFTLHKTQSLSNQCMFIHVTVTAFINGNKCSLQSVLPAFLLQIKLLKITPHKPN